MNLELELTILMPCLDEAETLATCIGKAQSFLATEGIAGEVLIADNGSTDGSQEIARAHGARVVDVPERGYGNALRFGSKAALGRYVIMGDADDSYDFLHLMPFVEKLREGYDLVMGDRFAGGIAPGAMPFLHRYLGNPVLSFLGRAFFKTGVHDFHCGLRGYRREAIEDLALKTTGMEYASEMVVAASLAGLRICEVPTTLSPDGRSRRPHLRTWRDGWRHLKFLLMYCPRWLFLYPGIAFFTIGILGLALLARGPIELGTLSLDIHTMLFMAGFVIVGLQTMLFKLLSDTFAVSSGYLRVGEKQKERLGRINTEPFVLLGILLFAIGLAIAVRSFGGWASTGYGDLDPQQTMRPVIISWTLIISGIMLVGNGFFLGILRQ